ncbi:MAG: T9SS type A sorting domain-containing protein [Prevotella sp.]|nr:T9SS type A sorting domain-containing protein [Bacteroides sp.]MCM1366198.1 T9SS type A sorting domain-containing protein [Prevotella sp.]MCM1436950.1 T9SS type A sorting domain-containing protein [Prevotella sp.]
MKNKLLSIGVASLCVGTAFAAPTGDWKIYPTFDENVLQVIDTPHKTYFRALPQPVVSGKNNEAFASPYPFLFAYDKEADELESLSKRNLLSENIVSFMQYNADKEYLFVSYDNGNIDLIFDNGEKYNIPALVSATMPGGKGINSVSFDKQNNRIYVAADFGLLILDDKKHEVAQSCNFDSSLKGAARVGDYIIVSDGKSLYSMPASRKFPTKESFTKLDGLNNVYDLHPMTDNTFLVCLNGNQIYTASLTSNGACNGAGNTIGIGYNTITPNKLGYFIGGDNGYLQVTPEGEITDNVSAADPDKKVKAGSWDFRVFYYAKDRIGLYSRKYQGGTWTTTREAMMPNAPAVFRSTAMTYSPQYGMLAIDHGYTRMVGALSVDNVARLSALKDGEWERYAPVYTKPEWAKIHTLPLGLAIDPDNPKYVYSGSYYNGLVRYNLEDPNDIVRFTSPGDRNPSLGTVYDILPLNPNSKTYALAAYPSFDAQGNLWIGTGHTWTSGERADEKIMVWPAEARKKGDFEGWVGINTPNWKANWGQTFQAFKHPSNSGIVISDGGYYGADILLYDSNKTPTDSSDDRITLMGTLRDGDGADVPHHYIYKFWEDMSTGQVWALGDAGVFYFNPKNIFTNPGRVNRVKIARNDGTNLADYLLNGIPVYDMTTDPSGRKYFATGGGLVVTSSDGKEIIGQYTTANSYLPGDVIYSIEYNPSNGSMLLSTSEGFCEFFPAGAGSADGSNDNLHIYPNPVRPDYYGWITIEGLQDGALVKIVDSAGNMVKELGHANGGSVQWDATNLDLKRVRSGVYYVMTSAQSGDSSSAKVGKILVIN